MPYHIGKKGSHDCAGYPVVNNETGKVMGCHNTEQNAKDQLAALYIHVEDANKAEEPNYENINTGGGDSEPSDKDLYNRIKREAKEKFDVYPSAVANAWVVREYKKRGGGYRKKESGKMITKADGFTPPKTVQQNAARGLELRREFGRGGTEVGVARARDLSNGKSLPLETINRMVSYFARHEVDKKGENWGNASNPSKGYIAWLLWGGDAGKAWANSIAEREKKKKEKSMALDITSAFAQIIKQEKLEDGTLMVYGKATDDSVDIDQQICDASWLEKAMPEWFKTGGNIREQHSNIAAGVAKELNSTNDGHYISALVVDPVSVKKVETGVLKGFSIGIRAPRIVRDNKAANGRIIDGQIVEVSLVDRPANPNAKLMLAKSDDGKELVQVEELIETVKGEKMEHEEDKAVSEKPSKEEMLKQYEDAKKKYMMAKEALDECKSMCKEAGIEIEIDEDEEDEVEEKRQYGESAEEETEEGSKPTAAEEEVEEAEGKSADTGKCLECGCNAVGDSHGKTTVEVTGGVPNNETANVSTATMVSPTQTPKSTIVPPATIEEVGTVIEDDEHDVFDDEEDSAFNDKAIAAIIKKAVKSATDSVTNEINSYKEEINKLQDELATAKTKAVAGGPKRTALKADVETYSEFLVKAVEYRAKAANTSDKKLAQGYKELAQDFEAKALAIKPTDK